MASPIKRNIYANSIGTLVQVLGPIISLPFYLSLLGPSQFGLVSIISTMQATLALLDSGFAQISSKEFAILTNEKTADHLTLVCYFKGFEKIYWGISIVSGFTTACMAGFLSNHWLQTNTETEKILSLNAIIGAGLIFAVQFPSSLYRSFLVGSQHQVELSLISSTSVIARNLGGIFLLWMNPTIYVYIIWQIFTYGLETLIRRFISLKLIKQKSTRSLKEEKGFSKVVQTSLKMFLAVLVGTITTQIDKLVLSGILPIEQFGYYSIASMLAIGIISAIQPIVQAISPLMMQNADNKKLLRFHSIKLAKAISAIALMLIIGYFLAGHFLLSFWLRNNEAVKYIYPLLSILLIGSVLNAYYHVGYYNWIALGKTRAIFIVNLLSLILAICMTPMLVKSQGVMGATFGFVAMNFIGLIISIGWIKKPKDI